MIIKLTPRTYIPSIITYILLLGHTWNLNQPLVNLLKAQFFRPLSTSLLYWAYSAYNPILLELGYKVWPYSNILLKFKKKKKKLCSSNCTHFFFNIYTFSNLSHSLYLFISPNILPWYLFLFPFISLYFVSFHYHSFCINLSFTLPFFT